MLSLYFLGSCMLGAIAPEAKVERSPTFFPHHQDLDQGWDLPLQGVGDVGLVPLHCLHARRGAVTRNQHRSCVRQDLRMIPLSNKAKCLFSGIY